MWFKWCGLTLIFGFVFRTRCHDRWYSWRIPQYRFCCGELSMGVPPSLLLGLGQSSHWRRRPHSHWRRLFSYAPVASWSRQARRYDLGGAFAEQGLVPSRAVSSWRAGEKSTHSRHSFQLPPRGAASGFLRCFHGTAWLPARSSFRLKARLLCRFHRAGQQPTPRGAASGAQLPAPRGERLNGAQLLSSSKGSDARRTTAHQPASHST